MNTLCFHKFTCVVVIYWMKISMCWKLEDKYFDQDISFKCGLNSMCKCYPNETNLLLLSCHELFIFTLPGNYNTKFLNYLSLI